MSCCLLLLGREVITSCTEELPINAKAQAVSKYGTSNRRLSTTRKWTDIETKNQRRKDFISDKRIRFIYTNALFYFMVTILCPSYVTTGPLSTTVVMVLTGWISTLHLSFVFLGSEAESTTALTLEPLLHPGGDSSSSAYNTMHLSWGSGYIPSVRCTLYWRHVYVTASRRFSYRPEWITEYICESYVNQWCKYRYEL